MSPERDQDYFCEGVAEEIINALIRIEELRVASRTSSFQYKKTSLDSRGIGRRLGISTLLEGSVRKAGNRLRITAQLVDVASDSHLWSEQYDREIEDVFAIQEEIARNVVEALRVTLSPKERSTLQKAPTTNVRAYDCYLRGRKAFYNYGRKSIESALQMFMRAIAIDPNFALAYAGTADCYSYLYANAERSESNRERAEDASRKALDLDPDLAEAHAARGVALSSSAKYAEADDAFETAIRLNPKLFEAHYFYARHCYAQGKLEEAARLYEESSEVRPDDYQSPLLISQIYSRLGREDDAREARRRGVQIAEQCLALDPEDVRALYLGANGLVVLGEGKKGLRWADRALALEPEDPMLLYNIACIRSLVGDVEGAIDCLTGAIRHGFAFRGWLEEDTDLDPCRSHPRFRTLMEKWR
jgi:TolB-like protein/Tfp pilus assembly protein PilF